MTPMTPMTAMTSQLWACNAGRREPLLAPAKLPRRRRRRDAPRAQPWPDAAPGRHVAERGLYALIMGNIGSLSFTAEPP